MAKKAPKFNPWAIATIVLVILLAGFIFYDKSPTFHKNVNYVLGIENDTVDFDEKPEENKPVEKDPNLEDVELILLTDTELPNPHYDAESEIETLKNDINTVVNSRIVDINSEEGQELNSELNLYTIPVLIFDENIVPTNFYKEASNYFNIIEDNYVLLLKPLKFLKENPDIGDGQVKGAENGSVTIIEYSSMTCGYCAKMKPIIEQVLENYPDKVKFVYKHYDRGGVDIVLANAAECAGDSGKFWEMQSYIFDNISEFDPEDLIGSLKEGALSFGIDTDDFEKCVTEGKYSEKIANQTKEAYLFGIEGTPAFFVNDAFVGGATSYENLQKLIDSY